MRVNYKFQIVFDFDEAIPKTSMDHFVISKLDEKGIDVSLPNDPNDVYVGIYRDKVSDK